MPRKRGGPGGYVAPVNNPSAAPSSPVWTAANNGPATMVNTNVGPRFDPARYAKWNAGDDPGYQRVASQVAAAREADAAQRRSNIQQALISFGMVPGGFKDEYGDVDAGTKGLIEKNTNTGISQYARLLDTKQQAKTALLNRISSKGLFRSGARGSGLRRGQLDYDRSLADSMAQLMQNLGGFSSAYANNEMQRQNALANAMAQAYANYVPPTASMPTYVPGVQTQTAFHSSKPNPYQVSAPGYGPRGEISNPGGQIGI